MYFSINFVVLAYFLTVVDLPHKNLCYNKVMLKKVTKRSHTTKKNKIVVQSYFNSFKTKKHQSKLLTDK